MPNVRFLLFDGFSNMVLSCLLEPLRAVRDQGHDDLSWEIATPHGQPAKSSSGLSIAPDSGGDTGRFDLLVVISGYSYREHSKPENLALISRLARKSDLVIGADTASWILASADLLNEEAGTIHWAVIADFTEEFPQVNVSYDRFVRSGKFWTCGGASTALEMMLAYIAETFGPASAFLASTMFLHDAERQQMAGRGPNRLQGRGSSRLRQVMNLMVETIETPLKLEDIADRAGLTVRTLNRMFQSELSLSPGQYYQMVRLSHARELASNSEYDLREIALRCGYADASALSKAFRKAFGHPVRKSHGNRPTSRQTH
ncbi:GlxA family transcriptional regulator [Marivivens aquimaris]|uniref:GlxA family transcriptional regulator n=1 Tax=Marivivens aquimaris TaxID=2774876 RepID=UPI001D16CF13|nr:helix-turn-helix domain-containing protein [Marivivens aquimaris]